MSGIPWSPPAADASAPPLLIVGSSTRAAAWSALRAGWRPLCADLFADLDLQAVAAVQRVADYPRGLAAAVEPFEACGWVYTGAMENHVGVLAELATRRPLWGNPPAVLAKVRDPRFVESLLAGQALPCPAVRPPDDPPPADGRWVRRSLAGGGGSGLSAWDAASVIDGVGNDGEHVFQERIAGTPAAAVCLAGETATRVLGVTRQLVGEPWLAAGPFGWCGSIGPWPLPGGHQATLERLAATLAAGCRLRGLFGIDLVVDEQAAWPIEVNPRYTGSAEVLELASGKSLLGRHLEVFTRPPPPPVSTLADTDSNSVCGKAVLFAPTPLVVPELAAAGWSDEWGLADMPPPGTAIEPGRPICTVLATAGDLAGCREVLERAAAETYTRLGIGTVSCTPTDPAVPSQPLLPRGSSALNPD